MFSSPNDFSLYIETRALEENLTYMEMLLLYCEENQTEPEDIAKLVNKSLKDKIEADLQELNFLPKSATLY